MYQVLFVRLFNIVFGLFIHSTVLVVATYMIGLALGYFLARNIKSQNNLLLYGYLELLIGVYSFLFFYFFKVIDSLYVSIGNFFIVKFFLSMFVLLLPTSAMGLTLPIVIEYLKKTENEDMVDKVYGVNAIGASFGALLTSIVFINFFGLSTTFLIAFVMNVFVFVGTVLITKQYKVDFRFVKSIIPNVNLGFVGVVAFVYGFCGMALEIVWYRILVYFVANNTFSFSIILSVIILGISIGALLYKPLVKLLKNDNVVVISVSFFTGLYTLFSIFILNNSYIIKGGIYNVFGNVLFSIFGDNKFSEQLSLLITRYTLVLITSGIIALSSGVIVPSLFSLVKSSLFKEVDSQSISGTILYINTLGSIVGLVLITYVMISFLGFSTSLAVISILYIFSGIVVAFILNRNKTFGIVGFFLVLLVVLLPKDVTFTKYYNGFWNVKGELKFYKEGMYGTVAVFDVNNTRFLKINGIDEVPDDYNSLVSFKVMGNVGVMMKGKVSNVMVNALGGGITLSSVLHHLSNQTVKVVDICPDVKGALVLFSNYNYNVFSKEKLWYFIEDDGRNFLKSYKGKFEIIVADATHPASSDSWMLFTKEFYALVYEKLEEDGIIVQWVPMHNLENYDFVSILKTFNSVFSNSFLMVTGVYTAIVGKKGNLTNFSIQSKNFEDLKLVGIDDENKLKSLVFLSPKLLKLLTEKEKGEIVSDFKSSVEFAEFHRMVAEDTRYKNLSLILKYSKVLDLSEFTGLDPKIHYSMILSKEALLKYWQRFHYDALKILDKSLDLYPDNFYSKFLFSLIFPEFVQFVYKYQDQIKENYGSEIYRELVEYIESKMKKFDKSVEY